MTLTYHDDHDLKANRIAAAHRHCQLDLLRPGTYDDGNGHGCSVGCDAIDLGYHGDDPHGVVAAKWGTPLWLEYLRDRIFEGLADGERAGWHVHLAEAIPVGVDLTRTYHQFLAWLLGPDSPSRDGNANPLVAAAIAAVRSLHIQAATGGIVTPTEWSEARSAARSAAYSAADSADYLAIASQLLVLLAAAGGATCNTET